MNATNSNQNSHIFSFLSTISIIGTVGNLAVVAVYLKKRDKQTSTFFILVLAFSDLAVCSILVPLTIFMEKIFFETDNLLLCKTFYFLTTTIVPSSSLLMSAIAFDRYFCICKVNHKIMSLFKAKLVVIGILIVSFLLGIIPLMTSVVIQKLDSNETIEQSSICIVDQDSTYTSFGFLITPFKYFYDFIYAGSVITITILYILIYKEIHIRSRIKQNRKKEILYNSMISQSENGIFPETLLIKNTILEENSLAKSRFQIFKDFIFRKKGENVEIVENQNKFKIEDLNNRRESLKSYRLIKSCNRDFLSEALKSKDKDSDFINDTVSIKSGSNTQKSLNLNSKKINKNKKFKLKKSKKNSFERDRTINSKIVPFLILIKETRMAFMLFIISIVFISCYLPSILATRSLLPNDNLFIIYLYFTNSAINPIIYSFINRSFRSGLIKLLINTSKPIISLSKFSTFAGLSQSQNNGGMKAG